MLFTPGPVAISPTVQHAVAQPPLYHRSSEFVELSRRAWQNLATIFRSDGHVAIVAGTATTGLEACVASTVRSASRVFVAVHGRFGKRLVHMNEAYGAHVHTYEVEWGQSLDLAQLEEHCRAIPNLDVFWCVHVETSTGVRLNLPEVIRVVRSIHPEVLILVDAVTAIGIEEFDAAAWGIDGAVAGIQKGLLCPPGLACIHIGPRMSERIHGTGRYTLNLETVLRDMARGLFTWTPPVTLVAGLVASTTEMIEAGIPTIVQAYCQRAALVRTTLAECGFQHFGHEDANGVVVLTNNRADEVRRRLLAQHGIVIAGGQDQLSGRIVRIGICGHHSDEDFAMLLNAIMDVNTTLQESPE